MGVGHEVGNARLDGRDLATLLELIHGSHALLDLRQFRQGVLELVRGAVPCVLAAYNELEPEENRGLAVFEPPESDIFADAGEVLARVGMSSPIIRRYARTRDGRAYKLSDFLTSDELHETPLWIEALGPLGIEYQIAFALPSQPSVVVGVTLNNGERDFGDRERAILNLARPHLAQAYRNAQIHSEAHSRLAALDRGLEAAGQAAIQLKSNARVRAASRQAPAMLAAAFGRPADDRSLPSELERWVAAERAKGPTGGTVPLIVQAGSERLLIRFVRHRRAGESDVLLLERSGDPLSGDSLRALGLTARESEVLRLAALGQPVEAIATELEIRPGTVRKHFENTYRKLGVSSRSAAVTTAWAGAEIRAVLDPPETATA